MEKYARYFQGNTILPIPKLTQTLEPRTVSYVVTDLRSKRLASLKRENFEGLLCAKGVPCKHYCRRSFGTWDVLLPTEEKAKKLAGRNVVTKLFQLQLEYMGTRRMKVTICIRVELLFLSTYGRVEEACPLLKSNKGTIFRSYSFLICLKKEGFSTNSDIINFRRQQIRVIVEGR